MVHMRIIARLILLLSLAGLIAPASPAFSAPEEVRWSRVDIPTEGKPGDWVLATGSNVKHLTLSCDDTLHTYVTPTATDYTLFKSTDEGYHWSYTGGIEDEIVDIATDPEDEDNIYYATKSAIYKSADAGESFTPLPPGPGGAGNNNVEITAIDVACRDGLNVIVVGT
jgi:hypothetical protein